MDGNGARRKMSMSDATVNRLKKIAPTI